LQPSAPTPTPEPTEGDAVVAGSPLRSSGQTSLLPLDLPEESLSQNAGVLPAEWIRRMAQRGQIAGPPLDRNQIQPASLDLRLGRTAYKVHASFLPGRGTFVQEKIKRLASYEIDLSVPQVLPREQVYIIEIEEILELNETTSAIANPKSSTGRLDVFTRIIADESDVFDVIPPGYRGRLWAEVSPRTFDVMVQRGTRLSQIRFRRRNSQHHPHANFRLGDKELEALHARSRLTDEDPIIRGGLNLRVNLRRDNGSKVIAYRARRHTPYIDFEKTDFYDIPFFLEDGQTIGRLDFERLAGRPVVQYGEAMASHYQGQKLKLSKHFRNG
jgi:dCTP deaminase